MYARSPGGAVLIARSSKEYPELRRVVFLPWVFTNIFVWLYFRSLLSLSALNSTPSGLWMIVDAFFVWRFDPFRVILCFKVNRFCRVVKDYLTAVFSCRCLYAQGLIVVWVLALLKYSKISSFVILDNFALNLSLCWRINFTASNVFLIVFIFF